MSTKSVCSDCGEEYRGVAHDPCLAQSMMKSVRTMERLAREHREAAFNPNFRKLAYERRKELRELGLAQYLGSRDGHEPGDTDG